MTLYLTSALVLLVLTVVRAVDRPTSMWNTNSLSHEPEDKQASFQVQLRKTQSDSRFYHSYNGTVVVGQTDVYVYHYNISDSNRTAIRIFSTSLNSSTEFPTIIVVREERSVVSWQIPLLLQYRYQYLDVSRTLCPLDSNVIHPIHHNQTFYVEVSSQSSEPVSYTLQADVLADFLISTGQHKSASSTPSNPVYYLYTFSKTTESVRVIVKSKDKKCATLSIQDTRCPVFDLDKDVEYRGRYQTMTTQGAIAVEMQLNHLSRLQKKPRMLCVHYDGLCVQPKSDFGPSFYIVLVVKANDNGCTGANGLNTLSPAVSVRVREKNFTIHVEETIAKSQYYKATLAALSFFLLFYLVALIIGIYYHGCKHGWGIIDLSTFDRSMSEDAGERIERPLMDTASINPSYGAVSGPNHDSTGGAATGRNDDNVSVDSINSEDFDFVKDVEHDKEIFRTKAVLYVSDLAKKSEKRSRKNYMLFWKNLFTIAIFYGLPVIQLVMTYQKVLNFTGDEDICYYNFACIHPLGTVSAFNNIYSNIGYVMLGILFLILVKRRDYLHMMAVEQSGGRHKKFGIPQHFGLFYAMGLALCMEGVMSACYHVCPTVSNFQFDTSFMYIMACLCILKIYQNRHPDISAKSHSSFFIMALIIIVAVIGVVYGTNMFWIIFALIYMTASLILSIHLYYMGRWNLDRYVFKRLWVLIRTDWIRCSRPTYLNRMVLLIFGNLINWALALYGVLKDQSDFASFLLGLFIGNLLLYICFYIVSKILSKEKIPRLTLAFIVLAAVTWGFALWFFVAHLTSWQLSPAASREGNKECIVFEFYDHHDIWHFLSAISLFFSFLVILTLDDEIIFLRRNQIAVF